MPFPILPKPDQNPAEFQIDDPFGVRESILPLLSVNRDSGNLTGLGTAFCADPFRGLLTAQHIFEHVDLTKPPPEFDEVPIVMLNIGIVFGRVGLPPDLLAPIVGIHGFVNLSPKDPYHHFVSGKAGAEIVTDCLRLTIGVQSVDRIKRLAPLPLRCSGQPPAIGDRLMAIGYPELALVQDQPSDRAPRYVEQMFGAIGEVVAIHPTGRGSSRPWPTIELKANWRSGMSGGPLFNEAGEIVGLVSSSIEPDESGWGVGFAIWFGGFPIQNLMPFLDSSNPGWYRGYGVLRPDPWHFAGLHGDSESAHAHAEALGDGYTVRFGSNRYGTDDFMSSIFI